MSTSFRILTSALVLALGAAALCGAVAARWVDTVLLDTDEFVTAAEPLASDTRALETTSDRISSAILTRVDIGELAGGDVPAALAPLVEDIAARFDGFVREQVASAVDSQNYAALWRANVRAWHISFAAAVRGGSGEVSLDDGQLTVAIGPYVDLLASNTNEPLLRVALALVPRAVRETPVAVIDTRPFDDRIATLRQLHAAGPYLPWAAAIALAAGIAAAPRRRWGLAAAGATTALFGLATLAFAGAEASRSASLLTSAFGASAPAAERVVAALATPLWTELTWVIGAGALAAVVGALTALLLPRDARHDITSS